MSGSCISVVITVDFLFNTDFAHLVAEANKLRFTYLGTQSVFKQNEEDLLKNIQNIDENLASQDTSNLEKLIDEQKILKKDQERFSNELKTLKEQIAEILHQITELSWVFNSELPP
jgi:hypothetical protein